MPLRPVSELGLADVTDLASPELDPPASPPAEIEDVGGSAASPEPDTEHDESTPSPVALSAATRVARTPKRPGTSKSPATRSSRQAKSTKSPAAKQAVSSPTVKKPSSTSGRKDVVTPLRTRANASPGKRGNSKTGQPARPGAGRPSPRAGLEPRNGGASATHDAAPEDVVAERKSTSLPAKLGISVLSSAIGTAGGLYLVKKGLVGRS